jgi:hypothetical protein
MQLTASVLLVVIGAGLGLFADRGEMRLFGWVVAVVGVLGLVSRWMLARWTGVRDPRRPR